MFVEVRGYRWSYEDAGGGLPVVFLHGFPLSSEIWSPLREAIARGFRFLAPDLRGFGRSDKPAGSYTMDTLAEEVLAFADALGLDRFVLVGHSMGGYIGFRVAARSPHRLAGLVLVCTRAEPDTEEARTRRRHGIETIRTQGPEAFLATFLPNLVGETTRSRRPEVLDRMRAIASQVPEYVLVGCLEGMMERPDSRSVLSGLAVPVLVVAGEEDPLIRPQEARSMAELNPRARLVTIPQCGHTPSLEAPEILAQEVGRFLEGIRA